MSGGHFDYNCFRISQFADELDREIRNNKASGEVVYAPCHSDEAIEILKECQILIEAAGILAKEIEWFYSGDTGEEELKKIALPILKKLKTADIPRKNLEEADRMLEHIRTVFDEVPKEHRRITMEDAHKLTRLVQESLEYIKK